MARGSRASGGRFGPLSTGDCFVDSVRYLRRRTASKSGLSGLALVHGIVHGAGAFKNERAVRAWIELGRWPDVSCVTAEHGLHVVTTCRSFYEAGRISVVKRYTGHEALALAEEHGTCGPWDQELRSLVEESEDSTREEERQDHGNRLCEF